MNRSFCLLDQNPDSPKFPKNLDIQTKIFLDIQTHPHLSPITTDFVFSIKVQLKAF